MGIVFFCQSCGARFEVDPRMAGKKGRCTKCGQHMEIPHAEKIASMAAMPALAAAGVGTAAVGTAAPVGSALEADLSKIKLAPITVDRMRLPFGVKKPALPDLETDSKPYVLAKPLVEGRGRVRPQDNVVLMVWRQQIGGLQRLFRKLNEFAYLVSTPFLIVFLLGNVVRSRSLVMLAATVVVLLNVARLVAGGINLALVPLRDGLDWKKLRKPVWRVAEPLLTMVFIGLAFLFVPWLSTGETATRRGFGKTIEALEKRTSEELDKARALGQSKTPP
jgi:hypothetical protein